MSDEPHDVVKLLLARMQSHPEEFKLEQNRYHSRWFDHINAVNSYGNEVDKAALNAKLRDIRLSEIHEEVMDELCNGEERRRKHKENEYERHLAQSLQHTKLQHTQQQLAQAYDFDLDRILPVANGGTGATTTRYPTSTDMKNNGIMSALRKLI